MNMEHVVKVNFPTHSLLCKILNKSTIISPMEIVARIDLTKTNTFIVFRDGKTGRFKKKSCILG